jgi:hypothetical protein
MPKVGQCGLRMRDIFTDDTVRGEHECEAEGANRGGSTMQSRARRPNRMPAFELYFHVLPSTLLSHNYESYYLIALTMSSKPIDPAEPAKDNWQNVKDAKVRKRIQDRLAQRARSKASTHAMPID